ncbi:nuclease-related domain-containing protein [Pseudogracilibacillus auburnensis]|uniref:nuclease-related domain-containing protein n=1 Tax=Pseudogracilibacillus auburnensis TaxID=1494959 RepID=UPI001A96E6C2|nr:NERD domain-containing protein [Pseudogracilibacillus auburnensis]
MTSIPHIIPMPSKELQILRCLSRRMNLSTNDKQNIENLHKRYIGERKFYNLLCNFSSTNRIELFDLLLESNNTEFQIDSLIISKNTIFCLEVKILKVISILNETNGMPLLLVKKLETRFCNFNELIIYLSNYCKI